MNTETRTFVLSLLNKYNTYQKVDPQQSFFDNSKIFNMNNGDRIEIESEDGLRIIEELCEALNLTKGD